MRTFGETIKDMEKYRVLFLFRNDFGDWVDDYLDCNGDGFTYEDALYIAKEMHYRGHANVRIEKL